MRPFLLYLLLLLLTFTAISQQTIRGVLLDDESEEPVAYAHIFLSDSSKGIFSDLDGSFSLTFNGNQKEIIISHVSYELKSISIKTSNLGTVRLIPKNDELLDVQVSGEVDKRWRKKYKQFKEEIFGTTSFAEQCKILNPWVINFDKVNGSFIATSAQPIEIANDALGYRTSFRLDYFTITNRIVSIKGYPVTVRNTSANEVQRIEFERNRQKSYEGSIYHFAHSLSNNSLEENGYEIYFAGDELLNVVVNRRKQTNKKLVSTDQILNRQNEEAQFEFDGFLQIIYTNPFSEESEVSWLKQEGTATINSDGLITNLDSLKLFGSFSNDRLANYLPFSKLKTYYKQLLKNRTIADHIKSNFGSAEKMNVYLHLDRDVYYPGEDIWFKGYMRDWSQDSLTAKKLYVELINKDSSITQTIIPIQNTETSGHINIPSSIPEGPYMIAAYSEASRNSKETHFKKPIQVGFWNPSASVESGLKNTTIFPEGGDLVTDVINNIAFVIKDSNGQPINGLADLYEGGKKILTVKTDWKGRGAFQLIPKEKVKYTIKNDELNLKPLRFSSSNKKLGIIVQNTDDMYRINLQSKEVVSDSIYIITSYRNKLTSIHPIYLYKTQQLMLSKDEMKEGVNVITVFDQNINPILERVVYIPPSRVNLNLETSSENYQSNVKIAGSDSIKTASFSAIDLQKSNSNGTESILVHSYMRPEIKGIIPDSDQLFIEPNEKHLDLLMLTNGWRNYNQKSLPKTELPLERTQEGFQLVGSINYKNTKRNLADTIFLINSSSELPLLAESISESGKFRFDNINYTDSASLFFVFDKKHSKNVASIDVMVNHDWQYVNGLPFEYNFTQELSDESKRIDYENRKASIAAFNTSEATLLEEVVVLGNEGSSLKSRRYSINSAEILSFKDRPIIGSGSRTYTMIERLRSVQPIIYYEVGGAVIRDVKLTNTESQDQLDNEVNLFIDNSFSEAITLLFMDPADIERIEFVKTYGKNGSLFVYTRDVRARTSNKQLFEKKLKGYQEKKDFYTEKLLQKPINQTATLHWDPSIINSKRNISFSAPPQYIKVKVVLEGFTQDNKPFRLVKTYTSN